MSRMPQLGAIGRLVIPLVLTVACLPLGPSPQADAGRPPAMPDNGASAGPITGATDTRDFAGNWRILSGYLHYDGGGGGRYTGAPVSQQLTLSADGKWQFGSSSGTFVVGPAPADADFSRWGSAKLPSTRKLIFQGWASGTGDGPVEETAGMIDYIWIIYRVDKPTETGPGTVSLKFGRAS